MLRTRFAAHKRARGIFVCAFMPSALGLAGCSDTPHDRVEAPAPAKMTTLPTPEKTASARPETQPAAPSVPAPTEAELGMPVYPNAKTYSGLAGNSVKPAADSSTATALLETPDSLDKVLDFYKARIKVTDARGNATPADPREEDKGSGKRKVLLMGNDSEGSVQMVQMREENGKTVIELMRASAKSVPPSVSGGK